MNDPNRIRAEPEEKKGNYNWEKEISEPVMLLVREMEKAFR